MMIIKLLKMYYRAALFWSRCTTPSSATDTSIEPPCSLLIEKSVDWCVYPSNVDGSLLSYTSFAIVELFLAKPAHKKPFLSSQMYTLHTWIASSQVCKHTKPSACAAPQWVEDAAHVLGLVSMVVRGVKNLSWTKQYFFTYKIAS